ncbi:5-oxoprolinase subunit PxpB [Brevibacillus choshinensis]|uniref:5-oxoprolinase subunit PxpB n=1 Tax=Brevibacillus choshinensis TaxID=54911 RepID=A0ABX7FVF5_BRECH|nr:5-oxoprolinase subunit PxpB [Brevibacillus choshinensis]QRG70091.1 5-oxoprolinase subunit PxpB [Brevibacillus choshinensis]
MERHTYFPLGDSGVVVKLGNEIDQCTHQKIKRLSALLQDEPFPGMVEIVPGYTTVTVYYDPILLYDPKGGSTPYERVLGFLNPFIARAQSGEAREPRLVEIPVCYGGEYGPDLEEVARYNGLEPEEVIRIHSGQDYLVHMIGFAPGFPYLGGLDERIATPRRSIPRTAIPQGSVGIGGSQTGVYPIVSPGGWNIIGRTALPLFRPENEPPSLLRAGDLVRFRPISPKDYDEQKEVTS